MSGHAEALSTWTIDEIRHLAEGRSVSAYDAHSNPLPVPPALRIEPERDPGAVAGLSSQQRLSQMHPDDRGASARAWMEAIERPGGRAQSSARMRDADGAWTSLRLTFVNVLDAPELRAMLIVAEDVGTWTDVQSREASPASFLAPTWALQRLDMTGIVLSVDGMVDDMFGVPGEALLGVSALKWVHPGDHDAMLAMWMELIAAPGTTRTSRYRILRSDGSIAWVEATLMNRSREEGIMLSVVQDVTTQLAEEDALRASQAELRALAEHMPAAVFRADLDGKITFANSHLLRLLGIDAPPASVAELGGADGGRSINEALAALVNDDDSSSHPVTDVESVDGTSTWRINWRLVAVDDSRSHAVIGVLEDITGTALLRHNAEHDPLTGLWNRRTLEHQLIERLHSGPVTVVFLDLDGFKPVNDQLGHEAGDQVLVEVGRRLEGLIRSHDGAARWGGDEFVLLLQHDDADGQAAIERIEQRVRARLDTAFAAPVVLDAGMWDPSVSVGVHTAAPGDDSADVLRAADEAMYRDKKRTRFRSEDRG